MAHLRAAEVPTSSRPGLISVAISQDRSPTLSEKYVGEMSFGCIVLELSVIMHSK